MIIVSARSRTVAATSAYLGSGHCQESPHVLTMPITRFDEVAEELFKLTKEVERLQKQLNEEREQRLRMEQAFSERLQKIEQPIDSLGSNK